MQAGTRKFWFYFLLEWISAGYQGFNDEANIYIFLKTISMIKNIEFLAANGFLFNQNSPIKALGKKYFINENEEIKVDFLPNMCKISDFELPKSLENIDFSKDTLPIYNLPAV